VALMLSLGFDRVVYSAPLFAGRGPGREVYMGRYMNGGVWDICAGAPFRRWMGKVSWGDGEIRGRYKEMRYSLDVLGVVGGALVQVVRHPAAAWGNRPLLHGSRDAPKLWSASVSPSACVPNMSSRERGGERVLRGFLADEAD